jgi:methylase of polypeptide subunit release factors
VLAPGGAAFLEIGAEQQDDVSALLLRGGAVSVQRFSDFSGRVRCLGAFFDGPGEKD